MTDPIVDANVAALMAEFSRSGVRELHVRLRDFELYLSNDVNAPPVLRAVPDMAVRRTVPPPPPAVTPLASAAPAELPADAVVVRAPNLGTFYRSPKPGAPSYVELGSAVAIGDELCLIEVMKLFTAVRAEVAGRIHAVLAPDGDMVEAGQPLFAIVSN